MSLNFIERLKLILKPVMQWTEFYEYSKVLGNSQFQLLTFQPYKLIYAHMLAEVGKISDSIR